jgi:signal transduction histidine kinase
MLDQIREGWRTVPATQRRQLVITTNEAPRPVPGEAAIRQILGVLLDNALTHGKGTLTVTACDAGDALALDIADEGTGIDAVDEAFAPRHDTRPGTGIGLALARCLAEAEGGRLWLFNPTPPPSPSCSPSTKNCPRTAAGAGSSATSRRQVRRSECAE